MRPFRKYSILAMALALAPALAGARLGAQESAPAVAPEQAAAAWQLPPGFRATLFAGEPAIVQPIAFTFDDRGRVWVIECLSYPTWKADGIGRDRVIILEDTDGDGRHDKRTVFLDNGVNLTGIEVGFGGVWLTSAPNFLFVPDSDGDDRPDGPAKILLDGWTLDAKHNVVGNLAWGPDGWLYGCHGITNPSLVGKPGLPAERRQKVSCGVWRYHPVRHEFEVYANGTTNPWGIDWDERGQMFITNCVIKHIFHVVPGAHFVRMFGQDPNPHVYGLLESCADHQHWAGGHWTTARGGEAHHDFGGGHAHSGCMIYLGDNWPAEYRGNAFLLNIHGQRLNRDKLERQGSGYVAKHAADFGFSKDPWFRGLHAKYGPDGGVYVSDWSDTGECHDAKEDQCDKTGGRIFKIVYEGGASADARRSASPVNLAQLSDQQLLELQAHPNEWHARHSRRLLQERAASNRLNQALVSESLQTQVLGAKDDAHRLRLLYTDHVIADSVPHNFEIVSWSAKDETIRAQSVVLHVERQPVPQDIVESLASLARREQSPFVRLHLAAASQRLPVNERITVALGLLRHAEDAADPYLPLMYWYALEPVVAADPRGAIERLPAIAIPLVRQHATRRIVTAAEEAGDSAGRELVEVLYQRLASAADPVRQDILAGLKDAYRGRKDLAAPATWDACYAALAKSDSAQVRELALELGVQLGDPKLIAALQASLEQPAKGDAAADPRAITLLATRRVPTLVPTLLALLESSALRPEAIRALAYYDAAEIPPALVKVYPALPEPERQDAIQTLIARPKFALALLDAVEQGQIPRGDISALVIRELQALENKEVTARLAAVWGTIRPASADKKAKADQLKSQLAAAGGPADLPRGRALFAKNCAACHKLFGEGGKVGPELTGSQRHNLDYVLENVLDPSAIVPRDYRVSVFRLADGRVVQGMLVEESPRMLAVQTPSEVLHLAAADVEARKESNVSMMPEGLFDRLSASELRDLVAYLASPRQVPLAQ